MRSPRVPDPPDPPSQPLRPQDPVQASPARDAQRMNPMARMFAPLAGGLQQRRAGRRSLVGGGG